MQVLRVQLAEPRSDSLQLTDCGNAHHANLGEFYLEPSRNAIITGLRGIKILVRDWTRDRGVEIPVDWPDDDDLVRTFHG